MSAEYMHIGIPVLNKKPGMVWNEWGRFWVNQSVDEYDYKIEYLKFEEGTRFPEILSKLFHVAYKVDDMDPYLKQAQQIVFGPEVLSDTARLAFVIMDDALIELYEEKSCSPHTKRNPPRGDSFFCTFAAAADFGTMNGR